MRLLLVRHGETESNAEGRLQGHLDIPLSEQGRRESELLAERLEGLSIDALYTSTLSRARDTAAIVAERIGLPAIERAELMERDLGGLAGLTGEEIRTRYPEYVRARAEGRTDIDVPGWEQQEPFTQRVSSALEEIIGSHPDRAVAVITHGGVIGTFCRGLLGVTRSRPGTFRLANGSITTVDVLDHEGEIGSRARLQIVSLNDTCHLDGMRPLA